MKLPGFFLKSWHEPEVLDHMTDLEEIDTDYKVISVKELEAFIQSRERKAFESGKSRVEYPEFGQEFEDYLGSKEYNG